MDIFLPLLIQAITATVILTTPVAPITPTMPIHGLGTGVESLLVADGEFAGMGLDVPWQNWTARPLDCQHPQFWATIWSPAPGNTVPDSCLDNPLTLGNECNSVYQCNRDALTVAMALHEHIDHPGGVWCCNDLYSQAGLLYFMEVVSHYWHLYGEPPPLAGISVHVYADAFGQASEVMLYRWLIVAKIFDWRIAVTEFACIGGTFDQTAGCMEATAHTIRNSLYPDVLLWYILRAKPSQSLVTTDLQDEAGAWTPVGARWLGLAGQ